MSSIKINEEFLPIESGDNYIKFPKGTMICYGTITVAYANNNYLGGTINFPSLFTSPPSVIVTRFDADNSLQNSQHSEKITSVSKTDCRVYIGSYLGEFKQGWTKTVNYIAIGKWK